MTKFNEARVVPETLTDGSIVFNVVMNGEEMHNAESLEDARETCRLINAEQAVRFFLDRLYDVNCPQLRKSIHSDDRLPDGRTVRTYLLDIILGADYEIPKETSSNRGRSMDRQ